MRRAARSSARGHRDSRHHRHRLLDRHRHAQPRGAGRGRMGFRADVSACRCSAWAAPAACRASPSRRAWRAARPGHDGAAGGVELCTPAFAAHSFTNANMVATALFGDGAAACVLQAGDERPRAHRGGGRAYLAGHSRHHGLEGRSARASASSSTAPSRPSRDEHVGAGGRRHPGAIGLARRRRSLRLPSRRRQGDHGARARARARRRARSTTSARCWREYGNMSAPTVLFVLERVLAAGPAAAHGADRAGARLHLQLPSSLQGCVTLAPVILALVTLQRLGELVLARRNTAGCARRAPTRWRRPLSADRCAAWRVAGAASGFSAGTAADRAGLARRLRRPPGAARLGDRHARAALDDAHHRAARRTAGRAGPTASCRIPTTAVVAAEILCCRWSSGFCGTAWHSRC